MCALPSRFRKFALLIFHLNLPAIEGAQQLTLLIGFFIVCGLCVAFGTVDVSRMRA